MKTVNPYEKGRYVNAIYMGAKPPFFIAHSTEELKQINEDEPYMLIHNVLEYAEFIKKEGLTNSGERYNVEKYNIWIPTGEIYVPDYYISTGQIVYQLNEGKPIPTDNCYIKVYGFMGFNSMFTLATSAGLFNISAMIWDISAAVKPNFYMIEVVRANQKRLTENRVKKVLEGKRPNLADLRFIYYNLFGDMDVYSAGRKAYGAYMTKERVDKLRNTERIKKMIAKELAVIIPNLAEEILKEYSVPEMAKDMKNIVKKTLDKKENFSHKDAIEAMNFVLDNSVKAPAVLSKPQDAPLVEGRKIQTIGGTTIHSADGDIMNLMAKKPDSTEQATVLNEQQINKAESELGIPSEGYVMSDKPNKFTPPDKLFPDDDEPE